MAAFARLMRTSVAGLCRPGFAPQHVLAVPRTLVTTRAMAEPVMDDDEDFDGMPSFSAAVQRRVAALREIQESYDTINKDYHKELAALQAKYEDKYSPLYDQRKEVISGKTAVQTYDIADDGEADAGIPEFWLNAFMANEKVAPYITERDMEVLKHLVDVRTKTLTGEDKGFEVTFVFEKNDYFSNQTLTTTYLLQPEDDVIPKEFKGCTINWTSDEANVTVTQKKRRAKGKDAKGGKPAFTVELEPAESFFNIFDPPAIPQNPEELSEDDLDVLQEELSANFEIGFAIKDTIVPRAVEWFTGELSEPFDEDEYMDEYEDVEEEELPPPPKAGKGARR